MTNTPAPVLAALAALPDSPVTRYKLDEDRGHPPLPHLRLGWRSGNLQLDGGHPFRVRLKEKFGPSVRSTTPPASYLTEGRNEPPVFSPDPSWVDTAWEMNT